MEMAIAVALVGTLAVLASWHTAHRALGRRIDGALLTLHREKLAEQRIDIDQLISTQKIQEAALRQQVEKVVDLEKRVNDIGANVALRRHG